MKGGRTSAVSPAAPAGCWQVFSQVELGPAGPSAIYVAAIYVVLRCTSSLNSADDKSG
jgi:hypothetical protein